MRLTIPFLGDEELEEVREVLESGYLTQGPKVAEFEGLVADFVGSKYAFATSSCTTALHLSLVALGIGPGDEILVPDFTFPATANVVVQTGATPVLVDIDLENYAIDIEDIRLKIGNRTRGIIPMHPFGCSADLDPILEVAKEFGLSIIEDAATAIGTKYYERSCGNIGTLGCFSFHPRKVITTGEGGMIITNNDDLAKRISLLRSHGGVRDGYWYRYEAAGFNYRLSDVLGAVGVAQMSKIRSIIARRRSLAASLRGKLRGIKEIICPVEPEWNGHIYQSFVVRVERGLDRDRIIRDLRSEKIESTLGTYALHDQPFFQKSYGYSPGELPNSHHAYHSTITLPLYPQMKDIDLDLIAQSVRKVISLQV